MSIGTAIVGSALIGGAASLIGGQTQADAYGDAAAQQIHAAEIAAAESRRQYEQSREDLAPYREFGQNALAQYAALWGVGRGGLDESGAPQQEFIDERYQTGTRSVPVYGGGGAGGGDIGHEAGGTPGGGGRRVVSYREEPTYGTRQVANPAYDPNAGVLSREEMAAARNRFMETPGYQFRFEEGVRALDRSAAAGGRLQGGGHERELIRYGQGIGSAEFHNYADRLAGLAGMGQGATVSTSTLGQQSAGQVGNALLTGYGRAGQFGADAGTARASGYVGAANAVQGGLSNYLLYDALRTPAPVG